MKNEELERQAFEEVIRKLGFNDFLVEYGNYVNFTVQTAWVVWQRARAKEDGNDTQCSISINTPDSVIHEKFKQHFGMGEE